MKTNKPTIVRVILAIAAVLNDAAIAAGIASFEDPTLNHWYKILSFIFTVVVMFINTYYNNDFTEEAAIGTGLTRQLKAEKKAKYKGERYLTEDEDGDDEDENDQEDVQ